MEHPATLSFRGTVVHGDKRGRELGFPTANIAVIDHGALPVDGVYACWVTFPPATVPHGATISIGDNPTFDDVTDRRVEAFVHDFDGDLYGAEVEFTVHSWLRGMFRCESLDELIEKTAADVAASRIALAQPARRP
ncbi:MAG: riboflavin kinase [Rhodoglobus sp.]|uniref:riboflavin kinase n=1 Tax=uncultured Salinibacterium sp. TaxID=459274 RepID=UPI0030DB08EB|tara:strand:+ start:385 stop:792 length:408 start_codon:yes stop_codon:yes gene_type:complete